MNRRQRAMMLGLLGGSSPTSNLSGIWSPQGVVLDATEAVEQLTVQEPIVIYDTNPQILTEETSVFKMWYSAGIADTCMCYAESVDGINFTKYATNPVVADHTRSTVLKVGELFVMFAWSATGLNKLTSNDGLAWSVVASNILASGGAAAWDENLNNITVWIEGDIWYMLYDGDTGSVYKIGLATSVDAGETWTKSASNPVITVASPNAVGGAWCAKKNGYYYAYAQISDDGVLPTDIIKYWSKDLLTWNRYPSTGLAYPRTTKDEGVGHGAGQVADVCILEVNGTTYMYYAGYYDGTTADGKIKLATATLPMTTALKSQDGIVSGYYPELLVNAGFERPGAGGADVFGTWQETAGDGTIAKTTTAGEFRSGTGALKITAGASANTKVEQFCAGMVEGATYQLECWVRGDGTNSGRVRGWSDAEYSLAPVSFNVVGTTFTKFTTTFVAKAGAGIVIIIDCPEANGGWCCVDDVSLKRIL